MGLELQQQKDEADRKIRQEQLKQKKLRQIGMCPVGYEWIKTGNGWRCAGGSHFVSDAQLEAQFN